MEDAQPHPIRKFRITRKPDNPEKLCWTPPERSVLLYDALREAFPHAQSLPELMREATMEFFLNEKQEERLRSQHAQPRSSKSATTISPTNTDTSVLLIPPTDIPADCSSIKKSAQVESPYSLQTQPPGFVPRDKMNAMIHTFHVPLAGRKARKAKRPMTDAERMRSAYVRKIKPCPEHKQSKQKVSLQFVFHPHY
jgi:hypothetical protein